MKHKVVPLVNYAPPPSRPMTEYTRNFTHA